jgi:hypothetical protein
MWPEVSALRCRITLNQDGRWTVGSNKRLPLASGKAIRKIFVRSFGWEEEHRGKNHFVLMHPDKPPSLCISIPDHKEVDRCLLKSELRKAGISEEAFCKAFERS